jgi:regulator of protease activity HflC (stomatin/prohibitin superfamily)
MDIVLGVGLGVLAWVIVRCVATGFYTVDQNQRAVKTVFGRAQRVGNLTTLDDPIAESLREDEKERYGFP